MLKRKEVPVDSNRKPKNVGSLSASKKLKSPAMTAVRKSTTDK